MAEASVVPGFIPDANFFTLTDFGGINTKSPRVSIEDNECSWLENFFPIGKGNNRLMWGKGANTYVQGGGKTVVMFGFYNIGASPYGIVFTNDGSAYQFNTSSGSVATISTTASTFYNGSILPAFAQWGASGIVIVSSTGTNGYYAWDGTTLYSAGSAAPSWLSGLAAPLTPTGSLTSTTTISALSNTVGIQVGMSVTGANIPANTTVSTIVSTTSITISNAATGNALETITFNWTMPSGLSGTSIENYQNRVWIANGAVISFSAPSNGSNFSTAIGGGTFTSTDSFLKQKYNALKQANGYLYLFGDSSINYVGNVQTTINSTTSTVSTTFNNLNTDPQTGTPWTYSVIPFGRAIMLANTSGIYAMFGGSAEKVSDKLDGLFASATLPLTGLTNMPCGAVATVYGIRLFFLLVDAVDPFTSTSRPIMCVWDGNKWFVASQEVNCTFIASQEVNSQLTAWGTDGTNIFPMFNQASSTLTKKFQSKLWSADKPQVDKQELRVYTIGFDNSGAGYTITETIDTETGSTAAPANSSSGGTVIWQSSNGTVTWQSSNGTVNWTVPGLAINGFNVDSVYGKFMGLSMMTNSLDFTLVRTDIVYKDYHFFG